MSSTVIAATSFCQRGIGCRDCGRRTAAIGLSGVAKLAADKLAREKPGQTIQATVPVHEAWLPLVGSDVDVQWNGRGHFSVQPPERCNEFWLRNIWNTKYNSSHTNQVMVARQIFEDSCSISEN